MFIFCCICTFLSSLFTLNAQHAVPITIDTIIKQSLTYQIHPNATIAMIKERLQQEEGIPTSQQRLQAKITTPYVHGLYTFGLARTTTYSDPLLDSVTVQELQDNYNSSTLLLSLTLRSSAE